MTPDDLAVILCALTFPGAVWGLSVLLRRPVCPEVDEWTEARRALGSAAGWGTWQPPGEAG